MPPPRFDWPDIHEVTHEDIHEDHRIASPFLPPGLPGSPGPDDGHLGADAEGGVHPQTRRPRSPRRPPDPGLAGEGGRALYRALWLHARGMASGETGDPGEVAVRYSFNI